MARFGSESARFGPSAVSGWWVEDPDTTKGADPMEIRALWRTA